MIENITCSICGGPMTSRANSVTGHRFWGCNAYPKCKGTRNTDGEAPRSYASGDDDVADLPSERARQNDKGQWR